MTEPLNFICIFCHVLLDVTDELNKTDTQKIVLKNHINHLFSIAFKHIGETNRIILVTENGAEVAYLGALEDAMLMAKDIVSSIAVSSKQGAVPMSVQVGIYLQPMHEISDFSQYPNIVGYGINAAKQAIVEAKPNEIVVSRFYNENVSALNQTTLSLNDQPNKAKNDVLDDSVDLADLNSIQEVAEIPEVAEQPETILDLPVNSTSSMQASEAAVTSDASSWKYALTSLFLVVSLFLLVELAIMPTALSNKQVKALPLKTIPSSNLNIEPVKSKPAEILGQQTNVDDKANLPLSSVIEQTQAVKPLPAKKKVPQKTKKSVDVKEKKAKENDKFSWESIKKSIMQGHKKECTQAESALNQCR